VSRKGGAPGNRNWPFTSLAIHQLQIRPKVSFLLGHLSCLGDLVRLPVEAARRGPRPRTIRTMASPFVWFHNNGNSPNKTKTFLESLLTLHSSAGPSGMTMLATGAGPFAALGSKEERYGDRDEWIPFVAVEDVDAATQRAVTLGASLVREKSRGPAGEFTVVRDPGGAALGLWKKA
jgi:predicted enzyme related to lactoylglutathione lyase